VAINFARGTPAGVRSILATALSIEDTDLHDGVMRLATDGRMSIFWREKIPAEPAILAASIAQFAVIAYERAIKLPRTKARAHVRELFADQTLAGLSVSARWFHDDLEHSAELLRARWSDWRGDPEITFDKLLSAVKSLKALCDDLYSEAEEIHALFPKLPRKLRGATAPRVYFSKSMKAYMKRLCIVGTLQIEIAGTLEEVMFDLPDVVDESTVRKR